MCLVSLIATAVDVVVVVCTIVALVWCPVLPFVPDVIALTSLGCTCALVEECAMSRAISSARLPPPECDNGNGFCVSIFSRRAYY